MKQLESTKFYTQVTRSNRRSRRLGMTTLMMLITLLVVLCSSIV